MRMMIVWLGRWMEDWQSGFLHRWNYSRTKSDIRTFSKQWSTCLKATNVFSRSLTVVTHFLGNTCPKLWVDFYVRQPISCWWWCISSLVGQRMSTAIFLSCLYLRHYCVTPVGQHEWPDGCAKELIGGSLGPFHQPVFHPRASCTHWEIMQIYTSRTDIFPNLFQWHLDRYRLCHPPKTMLACAKTYFPPCWIAGYKTAFSELS